MNHKLITGKTSKNLSFLFLIDKVAIDCLDNIVINDELFPFLIGKVAMGENLKSQDITI